jgi:hypothetical protein
LVGAALLEFAVQHVDAGQRQFARCTKQLVSTAQSPIVELLNYGHDATFLEPSLFSYFAQENSELTLEQLLYGYLPDKSVLPRFAAYADHRGLIYLPRLGHLTSNATGSVVTVDSESLACGFRPVQCVRGTHIELCQTSDPLLETLFRDTHEKDATLNLDAERHASAIDMAFEILQRVAAELYACLVDVTRRVVVFRSDDRESFATVAAHGTAFLNATPSDPATEVLFIEDMAHQCGHILFSALTVDRGEYLCTDPNMPLRQLTGDEGEKRDLYTTFHGVFTEALMCVALHNCLEADVFSETKLHELLGRLSFAMKRFHLDLLSLQREELFTERGQAIIHECGRVFDEVYRRTEDLITAFDLTNQSYSFSYARFAELNRW